MSTEATLTDTPEIITLNYDWYHLQMLVFVSYDETQEEGDTASASLMSAAETDGIVPDPDCWRMEGSGWFIVLREDIRKWLLDNLGPYSLNGEYVALSLPKDTGSQVALRFKSHRNAIAFKMTWF
jgi:hypothetical protein